MTRRDPVASYGYVGLIVAAFALLIGIIAAPVLQGAWTPFTTASVDSPQRSERLPDQSANAKAERRG